MTLAGLRTGVKSVDAKDAKEGIRVEGGVNNRYFRLQTLIVVSVALALGIGISACANLPGIGGTSWKEEALLHDGSKIVVTRSVNRGGRHEIGQKPAYKEQSLSFTMLKSSQTVKWEDHFSEDLGSANFLPMLLDIYNGMAYLVATPMGCLSVGSSEPALCGLQIRRQNVTTDSAHRIAK